MTKSVLPEVRLITYTDIQKGIYVGTRLTKSGFEKACSEYRDLVNSDNEVKIRRFIERIYKINGHESILEHGVFTFVITGISRLAAELLESHRLASYLEMSFRAKRSLNFTQFWRGDPEEYVTEYEKALELMHPEEARRVLPLAVTTDLMITVNARELLHILNHFRKAEVPGDLWNELVFLEERIRDYIEPYLFNIEYRDKAWRPYMKIEDDSVFDRFKIRGRMDEIYLNIEHYRLPEIVHYTISGKLSNVALAQLRRHRVSTLMVEAPMSRDYYSDLMGDLRSFILEINGRSLRNFLKLRTHKSAQTEIREFAEWIAESLGLRTTEE